MTNFTDSNAGLTGVEFGSVATGDFDRKNGLDLLITGYDTNRNPIAKIYTNDGSGGFSEDTNPGLTGVGYSSVATGDFDGKNGLDLLITGLDTSIKKIAKIYTNDGSGGFTEDSNAGLTSVSISSVATGDFDGDDDLDLLITGDDTSRNPIAKIYTNDGSGGFTEATNPGLTGVKYSSVATGDFDGDDDLDLLITGWDTNDNRIAKIYTNDGSGGFTEATNPGLTGVGFGSVATGDFDGLDLGELTSLF